MSSSTDTPRRARVLRGVPIAPGPALADLGALSGAARRALNPAVVEEAQAAGHAAGYERGRAEGHEAGRQEALAEAAGIRVAFAEASTAALGALAEARAALAVRETRSLAEIEDAVVAAAFDLATALVGRELELASSPGRDALSRALALVLDQERALARLHPDDVATLGDHADLAPVRDITVVADPTVERGGCILEVGEGRIDAQLGSALARVKQVLAR